MREPFSKLERGLRAVIRDRFVGCKIYCRRDRRGFFAARIDLPTRSWCSARGDSRLDAIVRTYDLACEPAPGFPGWAEPGLSLDAAVKG